MLTLPRFPIEGTLPITVTITEGITEDGEPQIVSTFVGTCIFDETSKTRRGGDGIDIVLSGLVIIEGDIAPEVQIISGHVVIQAGAFNTNPNPYKIFTGKRIRSFDGTVHHTELELI